jgi:hypothetical protein
VWDSVAEGRDHELRDLPAGVLLLAGDQVHVADREGLEEACQTAAVGFRAS